MIFSELYSAYYNTVAAIISRILDGERNEKELQEISFYLISEGSSHLWGSFVFA